MPSDNVIIEEVQSILREDKTVSPKVRDRLVLALLLSMNTTLTVVAELQKTDHNDIVYLKNFRNYILWIAGLIVAALVSLAFSGKAYIVFSP